MQGKRKENSDDVILRKVALFLVKASDNTLSPKEFERLGNLLKNTPAAREYYFDFLETVIIIKGPRFYKKLSPRVIR